ncbi:MAG: transglutaminase-like domain-containing protein [Alkalilacustris sp.]
MRIRFGHEITLDCPQPTPLLCLTTVHPDHARPGAEPFVSAPERITSVPSVPMRAGRDLYGNACLRMVAPPGRFTLRAEGEAVSSGRPPLTPPALAEAAVESLPDPALLYLFPSRYCDSDRLADFAWERFGDMTAGAPRVQAICDFVHGHLRFDYMEARDSRTAAEALEEGVGVCRDFAQLAIALCRALNIPARYTSAYLGDIGVPPAGPMDFAAAMEVWLGGRWVAFDPRNNAPRIGRIILARGRDAADTPLLQSFGRHELVAFRVWTEAD